MRDNENFEYDFAISYAGEEQEIAKGIHDAIKEKYASYSVFFAPNELSKIVGQNGEELFEKLFTDKNFCSASSNGIGESFLLPTAILALSHIEL